MQTNFNFHILVVVVLALYILLKNHAKHSTNLALKEPEIVGSKYNILAYNVKAGRPGETCCWTKTKTTGGNVTKDTDKADYIATQQMKWLQEQMSDKRTDDRLDFVFLVEAKDVNHSITDKCADDEFLKVEGWDHDAKSVGDYNCAVVYWRTEEWKLIGESKSGSLDNFEGRAFNNVLLKKKNIREDKYVIASAVQFPHSKDAPLEKFQETITYFTEEVKKANPNHTPVDILLGGDFNEYIDTRRGELFTTMNFQLSEPLSTCCLKDITFFYEYDRIALGRWDGEKFMVLTEGEEGYKMDVKTIDYKQPEIQNEVFINWPKKGNFTPEGEERKSAEHFPIFGKVHIY